MTLIFGDADDKVRQKLAMPAAWADLKLRANFKMQGDDTAPAIARLAFQMKVSRIAVTGRTVLDARSSDGFSPILMDGQPYTEIYRIVEGTGKTVKLSVDPKPANGKPFKQWTIRKARGTTTSPNPELELKLDMHTRVEAQFG